MPSINVSEARRRLCRLAAEAEHGEVCLEVTTRGSSRLVIVDRASYRRLEERARAFQAMQKKAGRLAELGPIEIRGDLVEVRDELRAAFRASLQLPTQDAP